MKKSLITKLVIALTIAIIYFITASNDVKAARMENWNLASEDNNKELSNIETEEMQVEEKILKLDAKTGEVTEVDMTEIIEELEIKNGSVPMQTKSYDPYKYKLQPTNKSIDPIVVGNYMAIPMTQMSGFPSRIVCRVMSSSSNRICGDGCFKCLLDGCSCGF